MAGRKATRVDRLDDSMRRMAVRADLVHFAEQRFCETGVLPDETRVAAEVIRRIIGQAAAPEMTTA